ncbi:MAG TPA: NDP-sugar synthase [Candidatus Polarisedimenticolia bacterium]|nr:NDP-sugar synthase [Candidatus Polarisedimenticolia bacterium]
MTPRKAMVLAAGHGTRMQPLTSLRPKPALPVLNRPLAAHLLAHLAAHGVEEVVMNSHSLAAALEEAMERWIPAGMTLEFSREKTILGTAGGLRKAARRFRDGTFYLVNSDSLTDADLRAAAAAHAASGRAATLLVMPHDPASGYRPVEVAAGQETEPVRRVCGIAGRRWAGRGTPRTFTGIHVMEPRVLAAIPPSGPSDINAEVYPRLLDEDAEAVGAWLHPGWWFEAGGPARYLALNMEMLSRQKRSCVVGPGFFLDEEAALERSILGEGCRLMPGARVAHSVLWEGVTVGERALVSRCVVTDGVTLPAGGSWRDAVLTRGEAGGVSVHPLDPKAGAA